MSRVFPVRVVEVNDEATGENQTRWEVPSTGVEVIEAILARFKFEVQSFLTTYNKACLQDGGHPWAVMFFSDELPLAGHVAQIRGVRRNLSLSSYSWLARGTSPIVPGNIPSVSFVGVRRKAILKYAAEKSPLFAPAWEVLKDKSEDKQWFCISDSPSAEWVKATAIGDEELFLKYRKRGEMVYRNASGLKNQAVSGDYLMAVTASLCECWKESATTMRTVIEAEPDLPEGWHILGVSQLALGEIDGAIFALKKAHELEPFWTPTLLNLAEAYRRKKMLGHGLEALRQLLEINPFDEQGLSRISVMHEDLGQHDLAIAACKRALELLPPFAEGLRMLAYLLVQAKRQTEAVDVYEKITQCSPDDPGTWNDLGFSYARVGRFDEAVEACRKALALKSDYNPAWDSLGYAHLLAGDCEKAIPCFLKTIELRPDHPDAWRHLLHAYKRSGKDDLFKSAQSYLQGFLPKEAATAEAELATGQIS